MFAARDQENFVHAQQTTAANKPLNQGIRGLAPKTPGLTKTPFRAARNDENLPLNTKGGKTVFKDGQSKLDKTTFVTPLGPRNRAPLGLKATNAKAQQFKTPGPLQQKTPNTRRSARSKITVAPTEPVQADVLVERVEEDDEPDFGYAPPPIVELPDHPLEFPYDQSFPQFNPENMCRGYGEIYCTTPTDENGFSLRLKREQELYAKLTKDQEIQASIEPDLPRLATDDELEAQVDAMIVAGPTTHLSESRVPTADARVAADLLSPQKPKLPSVVYKQTKASEQKRTTAPTHNISTKTRPTAMLSKNTIGFPSARKPPSILPKSDQLRTKAKADSRAAKIDQSRIHPKDFVRLYGEPPVESNMWFRLREHELLEDHLYPEDDLQDDLFANDFLANGIRDDDSDDIFQLPMPDE